VEHRASSTIAETSRHKHDRLESAAPITAVWRTQTRILSLNDDAPVITKALAFPDLQ